MFSITLGQELQTGIIQTPINQDHPYFLVNSVFNSPVSLNEVRSHLRIDADNDLENTYLEFCVKAAAKFGESYTNLDFIQKKYLTFRNGFGYPITLRRGYLPLENCISSFKYILNGVWESVPETSFYVEYKKPFSSIVSKYNNTFDYITDPILQSVKIEFFAGFGVDESKIPFDIKFAILNHIAAMYENRGDADVASMNFAENFPVQTKIIYDSYKVIETY